MNLTDLLWVALGGGIGSLLRWRVGIIVKHFYNGELPLATFIINITGAFLIGYLSVILNIDWHNRYADWIGAAVLTGILGGYTTFSSMQLEAVNLVCTKRKVAAVFYLVSSVVSGIIAAAIGAWIAYTI